jgi:hypothetical protein
MAAGGDVADRADQAGRFCREGEGAAERPLGSGMAMPLRLCGTVGGRGHAEDRASVSTGAHADRVRERLSGLADDVQAEPEAGPVAASGSVEGIEETREAFERDAGPIVVDRDRDVPLLRRHPTTTRPPGPAYVTALPTGLRRIVVSIADSLLTCSAAACTCSLTPAASA